jgi:hypothetical protein
LVFEALIGFAPRLDRDARPAGRVHQFKRQVHATHHASSGKVLPPDSWTPFFLMLIALREVIWRDICISQKV